MFPAVPMLHTRSHTLGFQIRTLLLLEAQALGSGSELPYCQSISPSWLKERDGLCGCACVASVMRSAQNCVCASVKWLKCVCVCVCTLWRVYEDFPPLVQTDFNELVRLMKCHRLKKSKMAHLSFSPLLHQSSLKPLPNRLHMLTYMHPYL
jgi:hypothetical protein